jgi:hypothetical protein
MNFPSHMVLPTLMAMSIGILFYVLIYMMGQFTSRKEVKGLATESIADVSTAFIFVIIAFILFGFIENVTPNMLGIGGFFDTLSDPSVTGYEMDLEKLTKDSNIVDYSETPIIHLGEAYIITMFYQTEKLYRSMLIQIGFMNLMSSIEIGTGQDTITPYKGFEPLLNLAPSLFTSASMVLMTFSAQLFLLKFFIYIVPTYLFPLGILFRVFAPTRSLGGGIIALCFAMYFLYPLLLSYNFAIMVNILGSTNLNLDSVIYSSPICNTDEECNSNSCILSDPANSESQKYCAPCILMGELPQGATRDICCEKTSVYDVANKQCVIRMSTKEDVGELDDEATKTGKGGIITRPGEVENMGFVSFFAVILLLVVSSFIFPTVLAPLTSLAGIAIKVVSGGLTFAGVKFLAGPITTFIVLVFINTKFFFLGFILPIIQFIIIIEFVRVLTGSMGESINIMDMFKVI